MRVALRAKNAFTSGLSSGRKSSVQESFAGTKRAQSPARSTILRTGLLETASVPVNSSARAVNMVAA
jgi:hypothetical protein